MKLRNIFIGSFTLFATGVFAQEPVSDYRRSSIYSVLVNHTDQQFANEIKEAFLQIPVPDKFNDHNLSVKVLTMDKKLSGASSQKENPVTAFILEILQIAYKVKKKIRNSAITIPDF